jgi:hypothetical protein
MTFVSQLYRMTHRNDHTTINDDSSLSACTMWCNTAYALFFLRIFFIHYLINPATIFFRYKLFPLHTRTRSIINPDVPVFLFLSFSPSITVYYPLDFSVHVLFIFSYSDSVVRVCIQFFVLRLAYRYRCQNR